MPSWRNRRTLSRSPDGRRTSSSSMPPVDLADAGAVVRVPLEVAAVRLAEALPRGPVDVVDRPVGDGRQATRDQRRLQALGGEGQVRERREPAEALAEHRPALDAELAADPLAVPDDRVRPEVGEVCRLVLRRRPRDVLPHRRGAPGAALVDEQDPVLGERAPHPSRGRAGGPRRLEAGAALEEHQVRSVEAVRVRDLAGEDGDGPSVEARVVQRDRVLALRQDGAGDVVGGGHVGTIPGVLPLGADALHRVRRAAASEVRDDPEGLAGGRSWDADERQGESGHSPG